MYIIYSFWKNTMISGVTCSISSKIPLRQLAFIVQQFGLKWYEYALQTVRMVSFLNNYSEVYDDLQVEFR